MLKKCSGDFGVCVGINRNGGLSEKKIFTSLETAFAVKWVEPRVSPER